MTHGMRSKIPMHLAGAIALLSVTLVAAKLTTYRKSAVLAQPLDSITWTLAGFSGTANTTLTDAVLGQLKPSAYLTRTYNKSGLQADLFIAYYAQQRAGESMHSPKHCLPGAGWEIWNYGSAEIPDQGRTVKVNKYSIANSGQRMLVLYWYQSKGRIISSEYAGKLLLATDALMQNSTAASIVRIIVPDQPGALEAATALAADVIPQMRRCFGENSGSPTVAAL